MGWRTCLSQRLGTDAPERVSRMRGDRGNRLNRLSRLTQAFERVDQAITEQVRDHQDELLVQSSKVQSLGHHLDGVKSAAASLQASQERLRLQL